MKYAWVCLSVYAVCYLALSDPFKQYSISAYNDDLIFLRIHVKYMTTLVGFDR